MCLSIKYKFRDQTKLHFVTFSNVYWIDLFIREEYKQVLLNSWKYPVVAGIVEKAEDYLYSSARNYYGLKGLIKVKMIDPEIIEEGISSHANTQASYLRQTRRFQVLRPTNDKNAVLTNFF